MHIIPSVIMFFSIHFTNVTVNFDCFHIFSTEMKNYRRYFTVCRSFYERRYFKFVQTKVNMLKCCRNGGCLLPTDVGIQCACAWHCSTAVEEFQNDTYLKDMPHVYIYIVVNTSKTPCFNLFLFIVFLILDSMLSSCREAMRKEAELVQKCTFLTDDLTKAKHAMYSVVGKVNKYCTFCSRICY